MNMQFLRTLADAQLPLTVPGSSTIDLVRRLDSAGYIKAFIPPVHVDCDNCARQDPAVVLQITARGRRVLGDHVATQTAAPSSEAQVEKRPQEVDRQKGRLARLLGSALHSHR